MIIRPYASAKNRRSPPSLALPLRGRGRSISGVLDPLVALEQVLHVGLGVPEGLGVLRRCPLAAAAQYHLFRDVVEDGGLLRSAQRETGVKVVKGVILPLPSEDV